MLRQYKKIQEKKIKIKRWGLILLMKKMREGQRRAINVPVNNDLVQVKRMEINRGRPKIK